MAKKKVAKPWAKKTKKKRKAKKKIHHVISCALMKQLRPGLVVRDIHGRTGVVTTVCTSYVYAACVGLGVRLIRLHEIKAALLDLDELE